MSLYHLKKGDYSEFYHFSLQFLSYAEKDQDIFTAKERKELCFNLGIAILVSKKIFNFSEL